MPINIPMEPTPIFAKSAEIIAQEMARKRRINKLNAEKSKLVKELNDVKLQISELSIEKEKLQEYLKKWENEKAAYNADPILSDVITPNKFEGVIAEKVQVDLEMCVAQMDIVYENVTTLMNNTSNQIAELEEQVTDINAEISNILNELSTI